MASTEHHVAARVDDIAERLARRPHIAEQERGTERFAACAELISALYHHEFHRREQSLGRVWDNAANDRETADALTREISGLLDGANYEPLTMVQLDEALEQESLIPLRLDVDLGDYDEVLIYRRGGHQRQVETTKWRGLGKERRNIMVDARVVIHTRVKDQAYFDRRQIDPAERRLIPGQISLKQFQEVPRADIEMLLPSTRARVRRVDQLMIGVPALAGGVALVATKALPTFLFLGLVMAAWLGLREESPELDQTAMVALFTGLFALGGFILRQWNKLKSRRLEYLKTLSENLYFRMMGDGTSVIHAILAEAENQETVEAVLGYAALLAHPEGADEATVDATAETLLEVSMGMDVDVEIDDALAKLDRLGLARHKDGRWEPLGLAEALDGLDHQWDERFTHRGSSGPPPRAFDEAESTTDDGRQPLIRLRQIVGRFRSRIDDRDTAREGETD